jgi:hypothetical protein
MEQQKGLLRRYLFCAAHLYNPSSAVLIRQGNFNVYRGLSRTLDKMSYKRAYTFLICEKVLSGSMERRPSFIRDMIGSN